MIFVIKIGSNVLSTEGGDFDISFISSIAEDIKTLQKEHIKFLIVSSGAVMAGKKILNIKGDSILSRQILASVGQSRLMSLYDNIFSNYNLTISQILITSDIFTNQNMFSNAQRTIEGLLDHNIIPIINENDAIATEELIFGDNDFLSVYVSYISKASKLVIFSTAGGLYTKDGKTLIREVSDFEEAFKEVNPSKSTFGSGGMLSKLQASMMASNIGIEVFITSKSQRLIDIYTDKAIGTKIPPKQNSKLKPKDLIKLAQYSKGIIYIDEGAKKALLNRKALLAIGIKGFDGVFKKGDIVSISDEQGIMIGKGKVQYDSKELKNIIGKKNKEVIKTDDIYIIHI
ncbi:MULTISPECIES: glutamate 5-kinase [unclassified Hydrogenobaculum]|uniref:glutamate 5-kinase n=1 Tax=unclassified Hydrogenobaculum TaxID=2622382 RepID=UPI0001C50748|nr:MULTISPECIES: glutamate 5-kinase [unclassified Hydrogenobaculum]AEF18851.1 glutamate 5-kinase [Hydrogenobaculum sp. 3684]AEG46139.1 glutamate 5-kinase [Hydrogenobaculum sp. SHO]AGG14784.1 glutamate 5-kinase [Hydrogenobaculum sp. HO]AGH93081.1 glutamate 5-kinase [Hydrogenobaculum sp. SN]